MGQKSVLSPENHAIDENFNLIRTFSKKYSKFEVRENYIIKQ